MKNLKRYVFDAWVHPKNGGDDYGIEVKINAYNLTDAKKYLQDWLAKKSEVTNDFIHINTEDI